MMGYHRVGPHVSTSGALVPAPGHGGTLGRPLDLHYAVDRELNVALVLNSIRDNALRLISHNSQATARRRERVDSRELRSAQTQVLGRARCFRAHYSMALVTPWTDNRHGLPTRDRVKCYRW